MAKRFALVLVVFLIILYPWLIHGDNYKVIEIFDPQLNKIVKTVPLNKEINTMVENWINEVHELYPGVDPLTDDGYAVRFPLDPTVEVKNKWMDTLVEEVYLVIPKEIPPSLIIFKGKNNPKIFLFPGKIDELSNVLDFQLTR